eukprot:4953804-Prymnesium_polylepis.1
MLALRWDFHAVVFDAPDIRAAHAIIAVARGERGGGTELQHAASQVLAALMAARELKLAARLALPFPPETPVPAEPSHIATLSQALAAPSAEVVRVAVVALANAAVSHPTTREKLAARHCCMHLVALAQSDIVPVQRAALTCLAALAVHPPSKEELLSEGGLTLLLQTFEGTLGAPASSPRLRPLQLSRLLNTRRLAITALANLSEAHLA